MKLVTKKVRDKLPPLRAQDDLGQAAIFGGVGVGDAAPFELDLPDQSVPESGADRLISTEEVAAPHCQSDCDSVDSRFRNLRMFHHNFGESVTGLDCMSNRECVERPRRTAVALVRRICQSQPEPTFHQPCA